MAQRVDWAGAVLSSDSYDAFGTRVSANQADSFGYNGQWGYNFDSETGLILCTDRMDAPSLSQCARMVGMDRYSPVETVRKFELRTEKDSFRTDVVPAGQAAAKKRLVRTKQRAVMDSRDRMIWIQKAAYVRSYFEALSSCESHVSARRRLDLGDVDLMHLHHRLEHALRRIAAAGQ